MFQRLFWEILALWPDVAIKLIPLLPEYGSYRDLPALWHAVSEPDAEKAPPAMARGQGRLRKVKNALEDVYVEQLRKDLDSEKPSLAAKYAPREKKQFAAFGAAFVGAGAAAGASRTMGLAAAGFVSRSAESWRWNSVRPAAGPAALVVEAGASATASSAKTLTGAAATPASATPAASVPSCLLRACVGVALARRRRVYGVQAHASEQMR